MEFCSGDFFPLKSQDDVVKLFASELDKREPNLLLLSLIAGAIETAFCRICACPAADRQGSAGNRTWPQPVGSGPGWDPFLLERSVVEGLYGKFSAELRDCVPPSAVIKSPGGFTERASIRVVADFVWKPLSRSFHKDRPHIQTVYSFMTAGRMSVMVCGCVTNPAPSLHPSVCLIVCLSA